uniref:39S ribosomal protein L34, mitochondrial n=1 Tax=Arion vulgaris TaxID=1028688 RepID=A0A0B6XXI2_9EUPU
MFSQIRNVWKAVSVPLMNNQLFMQYSRTDVLKQCHKHLSVLSNQTSLTDKQQHPVLNQTLSYKKSLLSFTPVTFQSIRTKVRVYYKGSAWKRYNKHNIEKRLISPGGLEVLWRKTLKGRHQLAAYERILPDTVDGKILPDRHFRFRDHPLTNRRLPKPGLY